MMNADVPEKPCNFKIEEFDVATMQSFGYCQDLMNYIQSQLNQLLPFLE